MSILSQSANCDLALRFALRNDVAKRLIVGERLELAQLAEVSDPAIADGIGDQSARAPGSPAAASDAA